MGSAKSVSISVQFWSHTYNNLNNHIKPFYPRTVFIQHYLVDILSFLYCHAHLSSQPIAHAFSYSVDVKQAAILFKAVPYPYDPMSIRAKPKPGRVLFLNRVTKPGTNHYKYLRTRNKAVIRNQTRYLRP